MPSHKEIVHINQFGRDRKKGGNNLKICYDRAAAAGRRDKLENWKSSKKKRLIKEGQQTGWCSRMQRMRAFFSRNASSRTDKSNLAHCLPDCLHGRLSGPRWMFLNSQFAGRTSVSAINDNRFRFPIAVSLFLQLFSWFSSTKVEHLTDR